MTTAAAAALSDAGPRPAPGGSAASLPATLADFRDRHRGETIIVCGCGVSLKELPNPDRWITIGVNDVGRLFDPTYLVVVNGREQFRGDRFRYVETSRAKAVFSQLDLGISHPTQVRFRLGRRGGTDVCGDALNYTQNSPYVAVGLAAYLGARRIGLIGVDFTEDHFFARTGTHPLARQLHEIDAQYGRLAAALAAQGIEFVNLSPVSRLQALPRQPLNRFLEQTTALDNEPAGQDRRADRLAIDTDPAPTRSVRGAYPVTDAVLRTDRRQPPMPHIPSQTIPTGAQAGDLPRRIAVQHTGGGIIGTFMDRIAETLTALGIEVQRPQRGPQSVAGQHRIVWNGRWCRPDGLTLFCEHGWLPRAAFQISPNGINADSHLAPFHWRGESLPASDAEWTEGRLAAIRADAEHPGREEWRCSPETGTAALLDDLPPEGYLLVPLQMEGDTNIVRHVPPTLRRMQDLIDAISAANPPWPVIFKQHPSDVRAGNRHLRLCKRRAQDRILAHQAANIHQLLRLPRCRGVITLNSNVAHDSLLWDKPVIALGDNLWPRSDPGPFMTALPADWSRLELQISSAAQRAARLAYAHYLLVNQWTLGELADTERVAGLLRASFGTSQQAAPEKVTRLRQRARRGRPVLNVVARDRGWRFEDYKRAFAEANRDDIAVHCTELPVREADAWLYLRASELGGSPDRRRTLVQIHDLARADAYRPSGPRGAVADCAGLVLTHPDQADILRSAGLTLDPERCLVRPVGAPKAFRLREALPAELTIGWIGRPYGHGDADRKRLHWFVEAMRSDRCAKHVILLGERLEGAHCELTSAQIHTTLLRRSEYPYPRYPDVYRGLDCVVVTSSEEAGPSCLFEALAAGVPVIGTRVGWLPTLIEPGINGFLVEFPSQIADAVAELRKERTAWFARAEAIRQSLKGWRLEDWIQDNLDLALHVIAE